MGSNSLGLTELSDFIPKLINSVSAFLSNGIMFYVVSILIFAIILKILLSFIRR